MTEEEFLNKMGAIKVSTKLSENKNPYARDLVYHKELTNLNCWLVQDKIFQTKQFERYVDKCKEMMREMIWCINTQGDEDSEPIIPQKDFTTIAIEYLLCIQPLFKKPREKHMFFEYYIGGEDRLFQEEHLDFFVNLLESSPEGEGIIRRMLDEAFDTAVIRYLYTKFLQCHDSENFKASTINIRYAPDTAQDLLLLLTYFSQEIGEMLLELYDSNNEMSRYMEQNEEAIASALKERDDKIEEKCVRISEQEKRIQALEEEVKTLRDQERKRLQADMKEREKDSQLQKENISLRKENKKLKERLQKLQGKYDTLKDDTKACDGKEKWEEEKRPIDYEKKYLFVTNLISNLPQRLMEKFPNSNVLEENKVSRGAIESSDMVIIFTNFMSHKQYWVIKDMCENAGIPALHSSSFNVERIEDIIRNSFH